MHDADEPIWYAAYGTDMLAECFACAVLGKRPPGAAHPLTGARDRRPPAADRAAFCHLPLYFAGRSRHWQDGGAAVLDHLVDTPEATLTRRWLITRGQCEDLLRQDNGDPDLVFDAAALDRVCADGMVDCGDGSYARVVCLGDVDGVPVVAATAPRAGDDPRQEPRRPSKPYLQCLIAGLRETFALTPPAVRRYLRATPGLDDLPPAAIDKAYAASDALLG